MQGLVNLRGRDKSVEFRHIESTPSKQVRFSTYLKFAFLDCEAQREGIIFMELLRRGYRVTIGRSGTGEIDFVAASGASREYIQVTLSMLEESTRNRELRPL